MLFAQPHVAADPNMWLADYRDCRLIAVSAVIDKLTFGEFVMMVFSKVRRLFFALGALAFGSHTEEPAVPARTLVPDAPTLMGRGVVQNVTFLVATHASHLLPDRTLTKTKPACGIPGFQHPRLLLVSRIERCPPRDLSRNQRLGTSSRFLPHHSEFPPQRTHSSSARRRACETSLDTAWSYVALESAISCCPPSFLAFRAVIVLQDYFTW